MARHDAPIASGAGFGENIVRYFVFVAELQRQAIQEKSSFPEQLQRLYKNRVLHHAPGVADGLGHLLEVQASQDQGA